MRAEAEPQLPGTSISAPAAAPAAAPEAEGPEQGGAGGSAAPAESAGALPAEDIVTDDEETLEHFAKRKAGLSSSGKRTFAETEEGKKT